MIGTAIPAATTATLQTTTSSAAPTSPSRPSRLRGFTYLRNYAHEHLPALARTPEGPALTRTRSSPGTATPETLPPVPSPRERLRQVTRDESSPTQSGSEGWLPTVHGRSDLDRETLHPSLSPESASPERSMTRNRTAGANAGPNPALASPRTTSLRHRPNVPGRSNTMSAPSEPSSTQTTSQPAPAEPTKTKSEDPMPTIRFIPHTETRSSRPSLHFTAISRTLANHSSVVRVGRYSERDNPTAPTSTSTTPVGFKSKVVSRRHCEFWCSNGQWYVKDVKSSSGTFLNHVRLSPPGHESKPYAVNDGDVVQLGIDFKGGEEVIFRCVKIRIECNRGWQKSLNNFNTSAHKKLFKSKSGNGAMRESDAASVNTNECSICLNPVAPCQALFVAPCSHVWHWKCIKKVVDGPAYPHFICPNCRFVADLDADVEPPEDYAEYWSEKDENNENDEVGEASQQEPQVADDGSEEEEDSNDGVTRLTPSQEDGEEDHHDEDHEPDIDVGNVDPLFERSTSPPTSLPPAQPPPRANPFTDLSPNPPPIDPYQPLTPSPEDGIGATPSRVGSNAVSTPRAIPPSAGRRVSAPWRSESTEDLAGQARSPTPTNSTAFALAPGIETLERGNPPGAEDSKGE